MIMESQYWIWSLHYEVNLFSILAKWFSTCIPSIVESSLSSKSTHTIHLHDGGSALWIHSFWVFAVASYLVLLPTWSYFHSCLFIIYSQQGDAPKTQVILCHYSAQNSLSSSFREKLKIFHDLQALCHLIHLLHENQLL